MFIERMDVAEITNTMHMKDGPCGHKKVRYNKGYPANRLIQKYAEHVPSISCHRNLHTCTCVYDTPLLSCRTYIYPAG